MKILWLAWKDYTHPQFGGAEVVLRELIKRQLADGHEVTLLTSRPDGSAAREQLDGIDIIRIGSSRYRHSLQALIYYLRNLRGKFDMVIETVNTAPYFSLFFRGKAKGFALYHQLARDVWYFETAKPFSHAGYYLFEPLATWLLGRARAPLITVSNSTKHDLLRYGWQPGNAHIISEGIEIQPVSSLRGIKKFAQPTLLAFGAVRGMKRSLDQVKAFEIAKQSIPNLRLVLAGDISGSYAGKVLDYITKSPYAIDIDCLGRVTLEDKIDLMQRSHLLLVTSVKEGWCLVVTEAASQGTPAVVYDVDGLRDSVKHQQTGLVTRPTPQALSAGIVTSLTNKKRYDALRRAAWEWSKQITFEQSYKDFKNITEAIAS